MRNPVVCFLVFFIFINSCLSSAANGQKEFGFKMPDKVKKVEIPFELHNNLIVFPLTINNFLTLRFILDTGVETAILTEKLYGDIAGLDYQREITVAGPGIVDSVQAYVAGGATFTLPGGIKGENMNVIVLKDDYLKLSESIGENIYGIIGYDVFDRFRVDINYDDRLLTLSSPYKAKRRRAVNTISLLLEKSKPYISTTLKQGDTTVTVNLMIDTGASHATLLDYDKLDGLELPDKNIPTQLGRGIAGEIPGNLARISTVSLANYDLDDVLVSSPFEGVYYKVIKRGSKKGTIGGDLLHHFNVTIDYQNEFLQLRKSQRFKEEFRYDMSGMSLNAVGPNLDTLEVIGLEKKQPAVEAGIKVGDVVISVNGKNLKTHSLSDIYNLLRSRDGRRIRVKVLRNGRKFKYEFRLRKII